MSNKLVEFLRKQAPKDTESLSDMQLTRMVGDKMRAAGNTKLEEKFPDFAEEYKNIRLNDSSLGEESAAAFKAAIFDRLPGAGYALGAATTGELASALGFEGPKNYALRGVRRNQEQAAERIGARAIPRIEDVNDVRSFMRYAIPTVIENAPQLGLSVAGGVGGLVASGGNPLGAAAGAGLVSLGLNVGEQYGELATDPDIQIQKVLIANRDKPFVKRILKTDNYTPLDLGEGNVASHLMAYAESDGKFYVYPEVQQAKDGTLKRFSRDKAFDEARKTNNVIEFDTEEEAKFFSQNYKQYLGKGEQSLKGPLGPALVGGSIAGLMDAIGAFIPATKLAGLFPGLAKPAIAKLVAGVIGRGGIPGAAKGAVVGAVTEGGTEGLQELTAIAAEEYAKGKKLPAAEIKSRWLNATAAGALLGGPAGAVAGAIPEGVRKALPPKGIVWDEAQGPETEDQFNAANPIVGPTEIPPIQGPEPQPIETETPDNIVGYRQRTARQRATRINRAGEVDADAGLREAVDPAEDFDVVSLGRPAVQTRQRTARGQATRITRTGPVDTDTGLNEAGEPDPNLDIVGLARARALEEGVVPEEPAKVAVPDTIPPSPIALPLYGQGKRLPITRSGGKDRDSGRVIYALRKDDKIYVNNANRNQAGVVTIENTSDLIPRGRAARNTTGRKLDSLIEAGFMIEDGPLVLTQAMPNVKMVVTPEEWAGYKATNTATQARLGLAIEEGTVDLLEEMVGAASPEDLIALRYLQSELVDRASNKSPKAIMSGLLAPLDSARESLKRFQQSDVDPTALFSQKDGKLFGIFTPDEWQAFKLLVLSQEPSPNITSETMTRAQEMLLLQFVEDPRHPTFRQAKMGLRAQAQAIAVLGETREVGDEGFKTKGAGPLREVAESTQVREEAGKELAGEADVVAEVIAAEEVTDEVLEGHASNFFATFPRIANEVEFRSALMVYARNPENQSFAHRLGRARKTPKAKQQFTKDLYAAWAKSDTGIQFGRRVTELVHRPGDLQGGSGTPQPRVDGELPTGVVSTQHEPDGSGSVRDEAAAGDSAGRVAGWQEPENPSEMTVSRYIAWIAVKNRNLIPKKFIHQKGPVTGNLTDDGIRFYQARYKELTSQPAASQPPVQPNPVVGKRDRESGEYPVTDSAGRVAPALVDPAAMTAGQINKELDKLDTQDSSVTDRLIAEGRGSETPSESRTKTDLLSIEQTRILDRRAELIDEIRARMGPDHPRRIPTGKGNQMFARRITRRSKPRPIKDDDLALAYQLDAQKLDGSIVRKFVAHINAASVSPELKAYFSDLLDFHNTRDALRRLDNQFESQLSRILGGLARSMPRNESEGLIDHRNRRKQSPEYREVNDPYQARREVLQDLLDDVSERFGGDGNPGYATTMYDLIGILEHASEWSALNSPNLLQVANELSVAFQAQSKPTIAYRATGTFIRRSWGRVVEQLRHSGITVDLVEGDTGGVFEQLANGDRQIILTMNDVMAPSEGDLRVALHETVHVLFNALNETERARIHRAMDRFADSGFTNASITEETDLDVRAEEKLAELLETERVPEAASVAQSIWRSIKEVYFRVAQAVLSKLRNFGTARWADAIALRFVKNRMQQFLSGDPSPAGLVWTAGGPSLTLSNWRRTLSGWGQETTSGFDMVPPVDESSAAFNIAVITRNSTPKGPSYLGVGNEAIKTNINIASINEQLEVGALGLTAAAETPEVQVFMAKRPGQLLNYVKQWFGLGDYQKLKESFINRVEDPDVNPDQRVNDFKSESARAPAQVLAYQSLQQDLDRISNGAREAEVQAEAKSQGLEDDRLRVRTVNINYLSAIALKKEILAGVRGMLRTERTAVGKARRLGIITQQIRQLDNRSENLIARDYAGVFKKLFRSGELRGRNLFDTLDAMINEANVDFTRPISEIRSHLADKVAAGGSPELAMLTNATPESRALLATVVAYGKANDRILVQIERRRQRSTEERNALQKELDDILAGRKETNKGITEVASTSKLAERARIAYRKEVIKLRAKESQVEELQAKAAAGRAMQASILERIESIQRSMELRPRVTFGDSVVYNVPLKANATKGEIVEQRRTLHLNASRNITDPSQLKRDIALQTDFLRFREAAAENGDENALDSTYLAILEQRNELLKGGFFESDVIKTDFSVKGLAFSPVTRMFQAFGTATGRLGRAMFSKEAAIMGVLRNPTQKRAWEVQRTRDEVIKVLNRGLPTTRRGPFGLFKSEGDLTMDRFYDLFLDPTADIIEDEIGLNEEYAQGNITETQLRTRLYQKIINHFLNDPTTKRYVEGKEAAVTKTLSAFMDASFKTGKYYNDFNEKNDVGVLDQRTIVTGLDGKSEAGIRKSFAIGYQTFASFINKRARNLSDLMNKGGVPWTEFSEAVKTLRKDPENIQNINVYFTPQIWDLFVRPLAMMTRYSGFHAPVLADGVTRPEADTTIVRAALEQADGDVIAFIKLMHDLHEGTDLETYTFDVLEEFNNWYEDVTRIAGDENKGRGPKNPGRHELIKGMVGNSLINSRILTRWPTEWRSRIAFDEGTVHNTNTRIAAQIAFGRDQERLSSMFATLEDETKTRLEPLNTAFDRAKKISGSKVEIERFVMKELGKRRFKELMKLRKLQGLIETSQTQIFDYYNHKETDLGATRWATQLISTLAQLILNQPGTALLQYSELFGAIIEYGASKASVKQVMRAWKTLGEDAAGGVTEVFGMTMLQGSRLHNKYVELGLNDPVGHRKFFGRTENGFRSDIISDRGRRDEEKIGPVTRGLRRLPNLLNFDISAKKGKSRFTPVRPLAAFTQAVGQTNRAQTFGVWGRVEDMIVQGMDFFANNPAAEADPGYRITAEDLGLKGLGKFSFNKFSKEMVYYLGTDLSGLVREAQAAGAGPGSNSLISDKNLGLLHSMALGELSLEGNLATMSARAFTNTSLRLMLPLWGWPIRRGFQVGRLRFNEDGQFKLNALSAGMLAMAVATTAGLAFSILIDEYHENVLGKKRNLRSASGLLDAPTGMEAILTFIEATNRVGTFGILGEVMNTATNVAAGEGDNRGLSLDQRVVGMNSILTGFRAVQNLIAQGDVDYSNVVRPLMASVGGNGLLQYMQITNNIFDLDNVEARTVARMNAQNWMRVGGRMAKMEVRKNKGGGFAMPNRLTPVMTRLVLATYADDPQLFARAYREALVVAREEGKPDPAAYIREGFRSRHPLKNVFRTITQADYARLLASLPDDGRRDISEAVNVYNRYLKKLGASAFDGTETPSSNRTTTTPALPRLPRLSAAAFGL